jgi:hypothetical protein
MLHEQELQENMQSNDLAFMFEDWISGQFAIAAKNMKRILKDLQTIDNQMTMDVIASNTSHLEIDWTEMKIVSKWRYAKLLYQIMY